MNVRLIAWLAFVLPFAAANLAYLVAASSGQVDWCFPYLQGCTSVSRAARHGDANYLFRGLMMPCAVVLVLFWWLAYAWLRELGAVQRRRARATLLFGVTGALFLILYVTYLGVEGPVYQWMRRYGVVFYFACTVVAQMLLTNVAVQLPAVPSGLKRVLVAFCWALLGLGLASVPLQNLVADADAAADAIEWIYGLLMSMFFPLLGRAWTASGFRVVAEVRDAPARN